MKTTIKSLLKIYDNAKQATKEYDKAVDAVIKCISYDNISDEEYECRCNRALFSAGLTDKDGFTDVYEKERIARERLLSYIFIIVPKAERKILEGNRNNYVQMNKVIDVARNLAI